MFLPYKWRVTRYDPARRNTQGHYPLDDWCWFGEVGKVFAGELLTYERYLYWETAYVNAALAFLSDTNLDALRVVYLENNKYYDGERLKDIALAPDALRTGSTVGRDELGDVVRLNLRELIWCKLEAGGGIAGLKFYLHFGYDFYMYVGSISPSTEAIRYAERSGLFVEPMESPYSPKF